MSGSYMRGMQVALMTLPPLGEGGEPRVARFADGGSRTKDTSPIGGALLLNDAPLSPRGGRVGCVPQPEGRSLS